MGDKRRNRTDGNVFPYDFRVVDNRSPIAQIPRYQGLLNDKWSGKKYCSKKHGFYKIGKHAVNDWKQEENNEENSLLDACAYFSLVDD
ncbi:hypothetical protein CEXT_486031 [Caerostris extrusa]|uniref:Uncharacterized protein n=1 Tax=Caerostris extrusa TaxID=172846 RepID=A0AAV4Y0R6_CAEEX|nr:hypothetical protein CEXT_486031 [Caerostris extrusa]